MKEKIVVINTKVDQFFKSNIHPHKERNDVDPENQQHLSVNSKTKKVRFSEIFYPQPTAVMEMVRDRNTKYSYELYNPVRDRDTSMSYLVEMRMTMISSTAR